MPRSPFTLSDDQARQLAVRVAEIEIAHPLDPRNHRPFVRAFMLAVHEATGAFYSPAIYHRLLAAYAPQRRASTVSLAAEKTLLSELCSANPALAGDRGSAADQHTRQVDWLIALQSVVQDAVDAAMARNAQFGQGGLYKTEFYETQMAALEAKLAQQRADAAHLVAELGGAKAALAAQVSEMDGARIAFLQQNQAFTKLADEMAELRKFSLQSIDQARAEGRVWKERAVALEKQRQMDAKLMETFRQAAYRAGADIPDPLRGA